MGAQRKPAGAGWRMVGIAMCMAVIAWLLAGARAVYPPLPMFLAAVAAGWLYRGYPREAARQGIWAGLLGGIAAEWAYFSVRLQDPRSFWVTLGGWERFGLGAAEWLLYAACLGFFSAFVCWGSDPQESGRNKVL